MEQGGALEAHESSPVVSVFDAWKTAASKNGTTVLSAKRRRLISEALKKYPPEEVIDAVRGWAKSPFHSGQNEGRKVYNDLELLLRDEQHIEAFRDLERGTNATGSGNDVALAAVRRLRELEER